MERFLPFQRSSKNLLKRPQPGAAKEKSHTNKRSVAFSLAAAMSSFFLKQQSKSLVTIQRCTFGTWAPTRLQLRLQPVDRAEQCLRMCRDGRGLGSNLVSFSKGFSKHPHFLAIIKVDSEYLRFSFKLKVDYFILY